MLHSRLFGLWLPFIFHTLSLSVAAFYFEFGVYSDEIDEIGYYVGSVWTLLTYFLLSTTVFYVFWRLLPKKIRTEDINIQYESLILLFIFCGLLFFLVPLAIYGPPVLTGANRYSFNQLPMVSVFNIKLFLGILCFPLGLSVSSKSEQSMIARFLFVGILGANILYGEKFSGPSVAILFFCSGFLVGLNRKISIFKMGVVFFTLVGVVVTIYHVQLLLQGHNLYDIFDHFVVRVARQGQLWWKTCQLSEQMALIEHTKGLDLLFEYEKLKFSEVEGGMRYMMSVVMPEKRFSAHQGSLAGGYPTALMYIDGARFFYFWCVVFALMYILPVYLMFLVFFKNGVSTLLVPPGVYFYGVHLKIFQSGNLYLLSNPKYVFMYLVIFFVGLAVIASSSCREKET